MNALRPTQPHAIMLIGIPGSGKSFFAEKFASTFNAPLIQSDALAAHAKDEQSTNELIRLQLDELLKTKQSIVLEIGGESRRERTDITRYLKAKGYLPLFVWVQVDHATAEKRATKRPDVDIDALNARLSRFSPPHESEKPVVISGKHTFASQAKIVLKRLSAPRTERSAKQAVQSPNRGTIVLR